MEKYGDELTILPSLTDAPQRRHVASFWKVGANLIIRNQGEGGGASIPLPFDFTLTFLIFFHFLYGGGGTPL